MVTNADLGDAAILYAQDHGLRVFPCTGKFPAISREKGGKGLLDATTDEELIERFWAVYPRANIGIRTGDGFWVLDIDTERGGDESLREIQAGRPIETAVALSGKGLHYYFRGPGPRTGSTIQGLPGIDVRNEGGYIIAPPSIHPNGKAYEWAVGLEHIQEAPEWLLKALGGVASDHPSTTTRTDNGTSLPLSDTELARLTSALGATPADDYQTWVETGMALKGTDAGEQAFQVWLEWSSKSPKFPGEDALRRKWESFGKRDNEVGLGSIFHRARADHAWSGWDVLALDTPLPPIPEKKRLHTVAALLERLGAFQFLVEGLLPSTGLAMLFGESGCGKSTVAVNLALAVASGAETWSGRTMPLGPGRVVYISGESTKGLVKRLCAASLESQGSLELLEDTLRVSDCSAELGNPEDVARWCAEIEDFQERSDDPIRMIVVDTVARNFGGGDENSTKDMSAFVRGVTEGLADRFQTLVLLVHHSGHGEGERARGSSALKGALDAEVRVAMRDKDARAIEISVTKPKDFEPGPSLFGKIVGKEISEEETAALFVHTDELEKGPQILLDEEEFMRKEREIKEARFARMIELAVEEVAKAGGVIEGKESLAKRIPGKLVDTRTAVDMAVEQGLLQIEPLPRNGKKYLLGGGEE